MTRRHLTPLLILCFSWGIPLWGCSDDPCPSVDLRGVVPSPDSASPDQGLDQAPADLADLPADLPAAADQPTPLARHFCNTEPPAGAQRAADPPAFSGGACPTLYHGFNTLPSTPPRKFYLVLPDHAQPDERFPLLFMWHWLKGGIQEYLEIGELQKAANEQRFMAVIPESKEDIGLLGIFTIPWPFTTFDGDERMEEEYTFFDDMLSCVSAQYPVNKECVSSVGVSAGALLTNQLVGARSQYLASFISLSGGVGGGSTVVNNFLRLWTPPVHKLPAFVLWGGPSDQCVTINFQTSSTELEQELIDGGHFFVECVHNCAHSEPPVTPAPGDSRYASIWQFAFDHPFWLEAGDSPYLASGLPADFIPWCGVGQASAVPRTGACGPPACPF